MCEIKVPLPWLKFFNWSLKMQWNGLFRAYCVTFHRAWGMGAKPPDIPNTTLKISRAKGFSLLLILYSITAYFNFLRLCSTFLENPYCMSIDYNYNYMNYFQDKNNRHHWIFTSYWGGEDRTCCCSGSSFRFIFRRHHKKETNTYG